MASPARTAGVFAYAADNNGFVTFDGMDLKDFADIGYNPADHTVSGIVPRRIAP